MGRKKGEGRAGRVCAFDKIFDFLFREGVLDGRTTRFTLEDVAARCQRSSSLFTHLCNPVHPQFCRVSRSVQEALAGAFMFELSWKGWNVVGDNAELSDRDIDETFQAFVSEYRATVLGEHAEATGSNSEGPVTMLDQKFPLQRLFKFEVRYVDQLPPMHGADLWVWFKKRAISSAPQYGDFSISAVSFRVRGKQVKKLHSRMMSDAPQQVARLQALLRFSGEQPELSWRLEADSVDSLEGTGLLREGALFAWDWETAAASVRVEAVIEDLDIRLAPPSDSAPTTKRHAKDLAKRRAIVENAFKVLFAETAGGFDLNAASVELRMRT